MRKIILAIAFMALLIAACGSSGTNKARSSSNDRTADTGEITTSTREVTTSDESSDDRTADTSDEAPEEGPTPTSVPKTCLKLVTSSIEWANNLLIQSNSQDLVDEDAEICFDVANDCDILLESLNAEIDKLLIEVDSSFLTDKPDEFALCEGI